MQGKDRIKKAKLLSMLDKESKSGLRGIVTTEDLKSISAADKGALESPPISAKVKGAQEVPLTKSLQVDKDMSTIKSLQLPVVGIKKLDASVPSAKKLEMGDIATPPSILEKLKATGAIGKERGVLTDSDVKRSKFNIAVPYEKIDMERVGRGSEDVYDVDIEGPIGNEKYLPIMEYMKKKRGM